MADLVEDDLILESVTYFKYPSSTNENDGSDVPKIKIENESCENQHEGYDNRQSDYAPNDSYPFHYSPYFSNQNQCNYDEQNAAYHQYNNYPIKQEIKSESYDYCAKEQDCYSSSLPYLNSQYNYHPQPAQHHQPHQQHPHHPQQQHHQQPQHQQPHHQPQQSHHQHQQHQPQQHQQQQHQFHQQYQQNGHYWNNGWSHQYPEQPEQQCCSPQSSSSPAGYSEVNLPQAFGDSNGAKKRGRKKKIKTEFDDAASISGGSGSGSFPVDMMQLMAENEGSGCNNGAGDVKVIVKERRKHDRFNGMPEEEVSKRTLPDLLASNLDIVIIGINPGLFAAYKGHHYAGPGNHFWKCLYLSGLINEQLCADDDYKLLQWGIGFTNMVERATKGSSDLTRKEIREGGQILLEKLQKYKPKIAVFNGKLIFEVFSGKKEFNFGRQPDFVDGTNTYMWVMPSSSARCAQLPRASDKVPYYAALKKFRDYLTGVVTVLDENDIVFQYCKLKTFPRNTQPKTEVKVEETSVDELVEEFGSPSRFCDDFGGGGGGASSDLMPNNHHPHHHHHTTNNNNNNSSNNNNNNHSSGFHNNDHLQQQQHGPISGSKPDVSSTTSLGGCGNGPVIVKKKRGRPKKVRPNAAGPAEENVVKSPNVAASNVMTNVGTTNTMQPLANGNLW